MPANWLDPIGAFYDSQSAAYDNAASIADKTLRIVSSTGEALTAAQLAGRDSNADGQLSGIELNGLNARKDLNEDGLNPTGSELSALSAALASAGVSRIRASDYAFYTQGNGRIGTDSNFRTLRDTDNRYWINGTQWIDFAASLVKMKNSNRPYLISTDGADRFDSSYDDAYPQYFNNSLLTNFLAGGGNDEMGGSTRNDNLWGGTGNDTLDRKMIHRKCNAKQRRLHRAQKTQLFSE